MKKVFLILIMLFTLSSNAQWVQQYFVGINHTYSSIHFVNSETGYVVGDVTSQPIFLKTTNGGINWANIDMNLSNNYALYAMSFVDANTGYVCGFSRYLRKTTNGGLNWVNSVAPFHNTQTYNAICFLNAETGYIGGRYGMRAKTTNGGVNWLLLDTAYTNIDAVHFFDVNTGIMADARSDIYRTTDGGMSWDSTNQTDTNGTGYDYCGISFADDSTGYLVGTNAFSGALMKTTNKGLNWSFVRDFPVKAYSVFALKNSSYVWVGLDLPYLSFSSDGGKTWNNTQDYPYNTGTLGIYFFNPNSGFACGAGIYRTTNGGVSIQNISTEIPSSFSLNQNYPNPFNPVTKIKFSVLEHSNVKLEIFDVSGKFIQSLVDRKMQIGTYETDWDA